jgi:hypothetical protein
MAARKGGPDRQVHWADQDSEHPAAEANVAVFQPGQNATLLLGAYTQWRLNLRYVNKR